MPENNFRYYFKIPTEYFIVFICNIFYKVICKKNLK